jgi:hypothetical protein
MRWLIVKKYLHYGVSDLFDMVAVAVENKMASCYIAALQHKFFIETFKPCFTKFTKPSVP